MPLDFVHLHNHSEFSMLDGLGTVQHYARRAKELGQSAIAMTDHGTMCGLPQFYHACRKEGVEPILGCEFYFVHDSTFRPPKGEQQMERHHVVLLARGEAGYKVMCELSTQSHRAFHYKPLLDIAMIEALGDDAQHLVCLSGCAASVISHAVREGEMAEASHLVEWWRDCFPHFYMELQEHGTEFDRKLNRGLIKLAEKYNIPLVATNDPHFVVPEDATFHDRLLAIQTASDVDDPARFRFDGKGYWLKSRAEMRKAFRPYGDEVWKPASANTRKIARLCHTRISAWEKRTWHIPKFPDVDDAFKELKRLTYKGLRERGLEGEEEYRQRCRTELGAIRKVGIADFLLITQDMIQWAVSQGIPVGPGRGSVAGTLVGYLIGIHKIDPIRYDLMFARFLNPARPRMPDIDSDFGPTRRQEVFDYFTEKYGRDNVVHVAAFQTMKVKAAFRSLAKSYGVSFMDANRLSKLLPDVLPDEGMADEGWSQGFQDEIIAKYPELAAVLARLAGLKRAVSAHPAGVIIGDPDDHIRQLVPEMYLPSSKRMCGQYDLDAVEEMGLMKQDILSVRTLETIAEAVRIIEETTGEVLDPDSWVPDEEEDDAGVYAMLARGDTSGVFQMEGATNQRGIQEVGCESFEDIVSTTSLYRTGAISAGFPKIFNANRKVGDPKKVKYAHPKLRAILGKTWGVVLYQEQVMEMGEMLAGFSMEEVDDIKEAIKHKKSTLMQSMKPRFIQGCRDHSDIQAQVAAEIWHMIEGYSGYGYNRSHAVAYTMVSYQTARLKYLYPAQFIVALMRTVGDAEKRDNYLRAALNANIDIRAVDVNLSGEKATAEEGAIRFGFTDLKGIGPKQAAKITENRPRRGYKTLEQVEAAVENKGVLAILVDAGALRTLGVEGSLARQEELHNWQFTDKMRKWRRQFADELVAPGTHAGDGDEVCLIGEIVRIGPLRQTKPKKAGAEPKPFNTWIIRWNAAEAWNIRLWSETQKLWSLPKGTVVMVRGKWEETWKNVAVGGPGQVKVIYRPKKD